jgi:hypothetical protein
MNTIKPATMNGSNSGINLLAGAALLDAKCGPNQEVGSVYTSDYLVHMFLL